MFSQEAINRWNGYVNDWNKFAYDYLRIRLDNEQQEILHSVQVNPRTTVASGTARGKDYVSAVAGICFLYLTPRWDKGTLVANTKVIMTAPTDRQVKLIMVPEIQRIFTNSIYLPGQLVGSDIKLPNKEWYLTGFKADESKIESWTGFHAVNIMFIVTEATGIPDLIFNAIEGNLQGNSRLLIVFNHNIASGYAANSMRKPGFSKFRLNSLHSPNVVAKQVVIPGQVDYEWVKNAVKDWCKVIRPEDKSELEADFEFEGLWYRPNDTFRIKVLGKGPKVSTDVLVSGEWIELANKRWKEAQTDAIIDQTQNYRGSTAQVAMQKKSLRLGFDVAGMGRDSTCFAFRFGNYVDRFEKYSGSGEAAHMEMVGVAVDFSKNYTDSFKGRYPQIFIDAIGEGAGAYSRLKELSEEPAKPGEKHYPLYPHIVKASFAAEWNGTKLKDSTEQREFLNMRAYLHWAVRDWLDPSNKTGAMLPEDEEFFEEATEIKWKFRSDGRIQIEEKEGKDGIKARLKRSPDKFESLMNTFLPVPDIDPTPQKTNNVAKKAAGMFR